MKNKKTQGEASTKAVTYSKYGTVAIITTAVVIALVIFANLLIGRLPSNMKEIDMTDKNLYEVSDVSKEYLETLKYDVDIILLSDSTADERVIKYANYYGTHSDKLNVVEIDVVARPSYLDTYQTSVNSIVVSCPETGKYTTIQYSGYGAGCVVVYEFSSSANTFIETTFDAEGQLTSAIDYVTGDAKYTYYTLAGHDEKALPESITALITKSNMLQGGDVNILKDGMPDDCDVLIIFDPQLDLNANELEEIRKYMQSGGNVLMLIDEPILSNFNALMYEYGLEMQSGLIIDTERYYQQFAQNYGYYCIYPRLSSKNSITQDLNSQAILLYSRGMLQVSPERSSIEVATVLATSENGGANVIDEVTAYNGMYILGAVATETLENGNTSRLTVYTCPNMIEESITEAMASMSNVDIFMNSITENFSDLDNITIQPKSLTVSYNTISNTAYLIWSIVFIGVIPVGAVVFGLVVWLKRRRL